MRGVLVLFGICVAAAAHGAIANQPLAKVDGPHGSFTLTVDEFERMSQLPYVKSGKTPKEIESLLQNAISYRLAVDEMKKSPTSELQQILKEEQEAVYWQYWFNKQLGEKISTILVPSQEVTRYYQAYPLLNAYQLTIVVPVDTPISERSKYQAEAAAIYKQLRDTSGSRKAAFLKILQEKMQSAPTKYSGGSLGVVGRDNAMPAFYEAIRIQKPNAIAEPFLFGGNWHLAYIENVIPADKADRAYLSFLETKIRAEMGTKLLDLAMAKLRGSAKISINTELLKQL